MSCKKLRVILHIGLEKTGSTSVQKFLKSQSSYFETIGVHVPLDNFRAGLIDVCFYGLKEYICNETPVWFTRGINIEGANLNDPINDLQAYMPNYILGEITRAKSLNCDLILFSCETLGRVRKNYLDRLFNFFKSFDVDVSVILAIRNPSDLAKSLYQTHVRNGEHLGFGNWIIQESTSEVLHPLWDIPTIIESLQERFEVSKFLVDRNNNAIDLFFSEVLDVVNKFGDKSRNIINFKQQSNDFYLENTSWPNFATEAMMSINQLFLPANFDSQSRFDFCQQIETLVDSVLFEFNSRKDIPHHEFFDLIIKKLVIHYLTTSSTNGN